jgi:hypothetical protein
MRSEGPDQPPLPMPLERYQELVARRRAAAPRPEPLQPVPRRDPAASTTALAGELLGEAASRRLESGELLLISEEATLADLEQAAASVAPAAALPALPDSEPLLATLAAPRLLCPRLWEIFDWQPALAEHLRLLEGGLKAGMILPQAMLVGHVETFPERVEHLSRLRQLAHAGTEQGGAVVMAIHVATAADLAAAVATERAAQFTDILAAARPTQPDHDRRHALAIARLALGPGTVAVG